MFVQRLCLTLFLLLFVAAPALADSYIWTDARGVKQATADPPPEGTPYIKIPSGPPVTEADLQEKARKYRKHELAVESEKRWQETKDQLESVGLTYNEVSESVEKSRAKAAGFPQEAEHPLQAFKDKQKKEEEEAALAKFWRLIRERDKKRKDR